MVSSASPILSQRTNIQEKQFSVSEMSLAMDSDIFQYGPTNSVNCFAIKDTSCNERKPISYFGHAVRKPHTTRVKTCIRTSRVIRKQQSYRIKIRDYIFKNVPQLFLQSFVVCRVSKVLFVCFQNQIMGTQD